MLSTKVGTIFTTHMFIVTKKQGESDDALLARFRKKTVMSGLLLELRDRERFKKPSEKRKEKKYKIEFNRMLEKKRNY
jgi:small subunit ribosomal protein S21